MITCLLSSKNGIILGSVFSEDALEEQLKCYARLGYRIDSYDNNKIILDISPYQVKISRYSADKLKKTFRQCGYNAEFEKKGLFYLFKLTKRTIFGRKVE